MKKRIGLRVKFIALIVVLLGIIFAFITFTTTRISTNNLRKHLYDEARTFAGLATKPIGETYALYSESGLIKMSQAIGNFTQFTPIVTNVAVLDTEGNILYALHDDPSLAATPGQSSGLEIVYINDQFGDLNKVVAPFVEDSGVHRYTLSYAISNDAIEESARQLASTILIFSTASMIVSAVVMYLLIDKAFLNPLKRVSEMALAISAGHLNDKISTSRKDEIGDMADSVNNMAEKLKADINKLKEVDALKSEFMIITSHNLRTPLTVINGYLEFLQGAELPKETAEMISLIRASSKRLTTFAENMLTVSRIEAGDKVVVVNKRPADLTQVIGDIAKDFESLVKEKNLRFEAGLPPEPTNALISVEHIRIAVWNILENAAKFSRGEGYVSLKLSKDNGRAYIQIADNGIGIAPEEIPKLFTKFHRGTDMLKYEYEGTGIGLYISKLIIDEHGGDISVQSKLGKGTAFTISLPLEADGEAHSADR